MAKQLQARRLNGIDKNPWVEYTQLATQYDVVNLGQGFPDFAPPDFAVEAFQRALSEDYMLNQYTKAFGYPPLASSSHWQLDPVELASKFTPRTKALILNTPHNPLGKVFSRAELELIASLCQKHDTICISDEVYQWLVFDGCEHVSIASLPGMWERTVTIGSAGKTFSATGWKVGWALGPDRLLKHLRTAHQNSVYHCPTQAQAAVTCSFEREMQHFGQPSSYFLSFPQTVQHNRDHMIHSLQSVGLRPIKPQGGYFMVIDISDFKKKMPDLPGAPDEAFDRRFVKWLMKNKGLAAIPVSVFTSSSHQKEYDHLIRFCFVKKESTLKAMDERLLKWREETRF